MDSLNKIRELINSCLLPQLKYDFDSIPIERDLFKDYHEYLRIQLPLLYDWIQQHPSSFTFAGIASDEDEAKREIKAYLIVLMCEITFPNSIYQLSESKLIENAERILQNMEVFSKEVEDLICKYYEDKLNKDKWKKQLAAVHGFVKYLELRFSNSHVTDQIISHKFLMFCLSVALNIRSCYETHYKSLSTSIFLIMLRNGDKDDIITMNIHSVIYDAVFKDIHIMDSIGFITKQWNCLSKCLDFYENFDSFTWNHLDDMMEVLIRNITLAPDIESSICLLKFVKEFIVYFTLNQNDFKEFFSTDLKQMCNMNEYRSLSNSNTSYTCYRWAKNILQMFVLESHKIMQSTHVANQILQEFHKIYILAILPIDLSVVEPLLIIFLNKFIAVLLKAAKLHKFQEDIMLVITSLLETFYYHLQNSNDLANLCKFKQNLCKLLKIQTFQTYATK
ncbi:uncharacterized protein ACRADG_010705 [Cochliomyia hominivorax]